MVKPPKIRHSKSRKDPVTIDLGPDEISRIPDELRGDADPATPIDEQVAPISTAGGEADGTPPHKAETATAEEAPREDAPAFEQATSSATSFAEASPEPAHVPPPRRSGGSPILAGLIGAVAALAIAGALQWAGVLAAPGARDTSEIDSLRTEIGDLRSQVSQARPDPRVDALEQDIATLKDTVAEFGNASGDPAAAEALEARLSELDRRIAETDEGSGSSEALAALEQKGAALDEAVRGATTQIPALAQRLEGLQGEVGGLGEKVENQTSQPGVALAIAASALKSAIDRGQPFVAELDTYAAIAPAAPGLGRLRELAPTGVPSMAELVTRAPDAASSMIAADRPVDPDAGIIDRLVSSATSLIEVRPVGTVEGEDTAAIAARIEDAVRQGALDKAITEYDTLPDAAKKAGAEFIAAVRARQTADALATKALADAIKAQTDEGQQ